MGSAVLPINNLSIEGSLKDCKTTINLTVTNETNTSNYQLEASIDGSSFTDISTLPAHFKSLGSMDKYSFEVNPAIGYYSFYRIKTIDHDGNYTFSKVIYVESNCNQTDYLTIYPNPTKGGSIQLEYGNASVSSKGILRLINTAGNIVWKKEIGILAGKNHFSIPANNLPIGQYYVQLLLNNGKIITKQTNIIR